MARSLREQLHDAEDTLKRFHERRRRAQATISLIEELARTKEVDADGNLVDAAWKRAGDLAARARRELA